MRSNWRSVEVAWYMWALWIRRNKGGSVRAHITCVYGARGSLWKRCQELCRREVEGLEDLKFVEGAGIGTLQQWRREIFCRKVQVGLE